VSIGWAMHLGTLVRLLAVSTGAVALVISTPRVPVLGHPLRHASPACCAAETEQIIDLSPKAVDQLMVLKEKQGGGDLFLRMGVRAGGCSGMSYIMDFVKEDEVVEADTIIDYDGGIHCVIDPKSLMFLFGLKLDYSDALIGVGFSFQNPNAETTCGCGSSFGV